jgi:hypothetical protein
MRDTHDALLAKLASTYHAARSGDPERVLRGAFVDETEEKTILRELVARFPHPPHHDEYRHAGSCAPPHPVLRLLAPFATPLRMGASSRTRIEQAIETADREAYEALVAALART